MSSSRRAKLSAFSRRCVVVGVLFFGIVGCRKEQAAVVVIGGGPAGLAAAIESGNALEGQRVILLEKTQSLGGSARYAAGITALPGPSGPAGLGESYAEHVQPDVIDWTSQMGQEWVSADNPLSDGLRLRQPVGGGRALVDVLVRQLPPTVEVWRGVGAQGLAADDGGLFSDAGWRIDLDDGRQVFAQTVVVATGGFAGSLKRVRAALGGAGPLLRGAPEWADGTGSDMVVTAGGTRASPPAVLLYGHGVPNPDAPQRAIMIASAPGARWFDGDRRPIAPRQVRGDGGRDLWNSSGKVGWVVLGKEALSELKLVDPIAERPIDVAKIVTTVGHTAPDALGLIAKTGIAPAHVESIECPCAALPIQATTAKSLTGVVTDAQGRVLDSAGGPILGLYAAGEVAGFGGGRHPPTDSTMIAAAILSGRNAGRTVADAR